MDALLDKVFGSDVTPALKDGCFSVLIIVMVILVVYVLIKFGRRGDKGGNPR